MTDKRKTYEEKLDAQLKEWSAEIALFKAKADKTKRSNTTKSSRPCSKMRPEQSCAG